ncbi:AMP-binding protein [Microbulbifer sp. VTAC004]|uniref:AMP-binding protein n=1 Tax=unclassified Microbulbifer TaxID=2619833 RepID=UPI004039D986
MEAYRETVMKLGFGLQPVVEALNKALEENPEAPAVIHNDKVRSYRQLCESAQNIATQLTEMAILPGERLALDIPRSIALYELMLGCLIAGVSFMSLPRGFDKSEQIQEAKRANCVGILTDTELPLNGGLSLRGIGTFWKLPESNRGLVRSDIAGDEVYCVRTSGTTGEPKIVPIMRGQLSSFLENSQKALKIDLYAKWLWTHDLSFDYAIWETFGCLVHCGCLVVLDENKKRDARSTQRLMAKAGINVLSVTPSEFRYLFSSEAGSVNWEDYPLTEILFAGEKLSTSTFSPFFNQLDKAKVRLINAYGPSETTVFCATHVVTKGDLALESIPIGKPFPGIKFELLNSNDLEAENLELNGADVQDLEFGELKICGAQVFAGYEGGEPLTDGYQSGDICRLDEQGRFVFIGRSSGYQKINGFRVEPYEIEEYLQSHEKVDEAVVWVENTSNQGDLLLACVRGCRDVELSTRELRLACSKLPPYLRPSRYRLFDDKQWPINERGKTDRMSLRRSMYEQEEY